MLAAILAAGLAVGATYALIGITYNIMFSASRVMSFTAGQLGMLGGVLGALFINRTGLPIPVDPEQIRALQLNKRSEWRSDLPVLLPERDAEFQLNYALDRLSYLQSVPFT